MIEKDELAEWAKAGALRIRASINAKFLAQVRALAELHGDELGRSGEPLYTILRREFPQAWEGK